MLSKPNHDTLQSETMRVRVEMQPAASAHGTFPVGILVSDTCDSFRSGSQTASMAGSPCQSKHCHSAVSLGFFFVCVCVCVCVVVYCFLVAFFFWGGGGSP